MSYDQEKRDKKYNLWARKYPAFVSLVFPLLGIIYVFFGGVEGIDGIKKVYSDIEVVLKVFLVFGSIIPALFFLYIFSVREIAITLIPRVMNWLFEINTNKLLLSTDNTFSEERKQIIKQKIQQKYQIQIPDTEKKYKLPFRRDREYRKKVNEAVTLIREDTRPDPILFEHNCIYGFYRNLAGGLLLDLIIVTILLFVNQRYGSNHEELLNWFAYIIAAIFVMSLVFDRTSGKRYATRLYIVFLKI